MNRFPMLSFLMRETEAPTIAAIAAAVAKAPALLRAEADLICAGKDVEAITHRLSVIRERLTVTSPLIARLTTEERSDLIAEDRRLATDLLALNAKQVDLRRQIDALLPAYAQELSRALLPAKQNAAARLTEGLDQIEIAIREFSQIGAATKAAGETPSKFPNGSNLWLAALRTIARRVSLERR